MSEEEARELGKTLWAIADELRGSMSANQFQDYILGFIFFKFLSDKYVEYCDSQLGDEDGSPAEIYADEVNNKKLIEALEKECKAFLGYTLKPKYMWQNFVEFARTQKNPNIVENGKVAPTIMEELQAAFREIESSTIRQDSNDDIGGLFSDIDVNSQKLGSSTTDKSKTLYKIILKLDEGLSYHRMDSDMLGDAYEYLIGQFAANSGQKAGEFYTPQKVSSVLAKIVSLDPADPKTGVRPEIKKLYDPTCGSASLLFNVYHEINKSVGDIYGQEKNITTYNLARMNLLLHHIKHTKFHVYHGDTLTGNALEEIDGGKIRFDAIVANPPFSLKWEPSNMESDDRFRGYGVAPKNTADFAFILHMLYYLEETGTLAVIVPHGVLFRGGSEADIRKSIINKKYLDAVIGLPSNLFYSTGIPVCILVFKKCSRNSDVLFIDASKHFEKNKKQNAITNEHIENILNAYIERKSIEKYATLVSFDDIEKNDYNLNIARYVDTSEQEKLIDVGSIITNYQDIMSKEKSIDKSIQEMCGQLGIGYLV